MFISELYLHPVKSAAAVAVERLDYTDQGLAFDRQWMVVDQNGVFITQRKHPQMCFLNATLEGEDLQLSARDRETVIVKSSATANGNTQEVTVWKDQVSAADCGDLAADWLSNFLGVPCRLVEVAHHTQRKVDTEFAKRGELVGFADGFPTLVVTKESLDEFNSHLTTKVDMRRFRPNIVISGAQPYAEDQWKTIRIGEIEFDLVKPCSRCIMPSINPDTAKKEMEVNQVLLKTRRRDRATYFGQNALHRKNGVVRVGDAVEILE